jgi:hypothetical protein
MKNIIQSAVIPSLLLKVNGETAQEYVVEFPLPAVIEAEEKVGHSLTTVQDWFCLKPKDIPIVLEAGLRKHHPDVTAETVQAICANLNPEALDEVHYALCKLAFPRIMAAIEQAKKDEAEGKAPKNVPSGDAL